MEPFSNEYIITITEIFDTFSKLYNKKYGKNIKFSGIIKAYHNIDNTYYIECNLIVKDNSNVIIYNTNKDFMIYNKTSKIYFNQYELIDFYDNIDKLVKITPKMLSN